MEQLQVHWLQPAPQLGSLVRCEKESSMTQLSQYKGELNH